MCACRKSLGVACLLFTWMAAELPAGEVTSLVLINATSNQPIGPLRDGDTIDLGKMGGGLNVIAKVSGDVGSVRFQLDANRNFRTESTAPFAMAGDTNGNLSPLDS